MALLIVMALISVQPTFLWICLCDLWRFGPSAAYGIIYGYLQRRRALGLLGGVKLQPSEFAKIGLLLALARYLSEKEVSLSKITSFIMPIILIGVPFLLVLKQPDLGTAGVFCAMALPMFFWGGLTILEVIYLVSPVLSLILSAIPLILSFGTEHGWG